MKPLIVFVMLIIALCTGMWLYLSKKETTESSFIDMISASLGKSQAVLPPGSRISVRRYVDGGLLQPVCHYVMASGYISLFEKTQLDTTLVITMSATNDSILHIAIGNDSVFWQTEDGMYHYFLTRKR